MRRAIPVTQQPVCAAITLPGSKSLANRALLIAAVGKGVSVIENVPMNQDVKACINALQSLEIPIDINQDKATITITGCNGDFPNKQAEIFCNESGTLTRFIIPLCATQLSGQFFINAATRMLARPIKAQLIALEALGMRAQYSRKPYSLPMTITAKGLQSKKMKIPGEQSSQFLSGLLMAAPFIKGGVNIFSQAVRQPYADMTVKIMADFGVNIVQKGQHYHVADHQRYNARHYYTEPDISTASYFWALAGMTAGDVKVNYISKETTQADIHFLEIIAKMGCSVIEENDGIRVVGTEKLIGVSVNMRACSDTFMTVAAMACFATTETHITGLSHTRLQESDRINAMTTGLNNLGISVTSNENSIHIFPQHSKLRSGVVSSFNDHRVAMSLALLGARHPDIVIETAQSVAKTCPEYFERMTKIIQ